MMAKLSFSKATRQQSRARVALVGPSGSGKTYTGLLVATNLGKRVAVIDTEHGSASKYATKEGEPADGVNTFAFDVLNLESFSPVAYTEAIHVAETEGYDVVLVDSLSHAWIGKDGALEQADKASSRPGENRFTAWRQVTPQHNDLIESITGCRAHLVATMRTKTEYVIEENERGKKVPRKVGMAPVQRDGMEYEFDLVGDINHEHTLVVSKSRCAALADQVIHKPGADLAQALLSWLTDGAPPLDLVQKVIAQAAAVRHPAQLEILKADANAAYKRANEKEKEMLRAAVQEATNLLTGVLQ